MGEQLHGTRAIDEHTERQTDRDMNDDDLLIASNISCLSRGPNDVRDRYLPKQELNQGLDSRRREEETFCCTSEAMRQSDSLNFDSSQHERALYLQLHKLSLHIARSDITSRQAHPGELCNHPQERINFLLLIAKPCVKALLREAGSPNRGKKLFVARRPRHHPSDYKQK